jgi:hypothetical protein
VREGQGGRDGGSERERIERGGGRGAEGRGGDKQGRKERNVCVRARRLSVCVRLRVRARVRMCISLSFSLYMYICRASGNRHDKNVGQG